MANLRCDILQIWTVNGNLIFLLDVESSDKAKFIITSIEVAQISYIKYNKQKDMIEFDIISISLEIFIVVICFLIFGKMSWLWRKSNKMKFFFILYNFEWIPIQNVSLWWEITFISTVSDIAFTIETHLFIFGNVSQIINTIDIWEFLSIDEINVGRKI